MASTLRLFFFMHGTRLDSQPETVRLSLVKIKLKERKRQVLVRIELVE